MAKMFWNIFVAVSLLGYLEARITLPPEIEAFIDKLHAHCIENSDLTEEDHAAYEVGHKNEALMCYMKCLMLESKWMSSDGEIQYDSIIQNAHPSYADLLTAAINKCRSIENGADLCEKSYNFNYCMHQADPENWFLV
ncbi:pheromone-binding protein-related protein 6-like isoform X2 [Cylas formicarius]|uniref:Odorant binding protein 46 n=2 Tax=Neoptera TaxID=33340 RepID=A0A4Y5RDE1_NEZVI|nr:pheromone-binding protein-related protein 6-like isoform X2 [Cylas formicarius]QCZ25103.1 odorant binding protein 46 [Nezara viridula]QFO46787.1 odorant binding protein [Cylas formicarius]